MKPSTSSTAIAPVPPPPPALGPAKSAHVPTTGAGPNSGCDPGNGWSNRSTRLNVLESILSM